MRLSVPGPRSGVGLFRLREFGLPLPEGLLELLALFASISPVTLVVFILLLATTRARIKSSAFLVGWTVSLTVVFSLSYLLGTYRGLNTGGGGTALAVLEVLLRVWP